MKTIAVVLCGSGYKDGSEIRESVGVLWALSQHPVKVQCFAPDDKQTEVVNCLTGRAEPAESRNMLVESARIARGDVVPLGSLSAAAYDAIILPGGFGAAKNLANYAYQGASGSVRPDLQKILSEMHEARKPIGAVCIAPALVGLAFRGRDFELTLGAPGEAADDLTKMGHRHIVKRANECHVDTTHRIVSTPAYMYDQAPLHEIFEGIQKLVNEVVGMGR